MAGDVVLFLLLPGEGVGEAAGEDDAQHLHHDEDAAHAGEDHEDDANLIIQSSLYNKQATYIVSLTLVNISILINESTIDINLLDENPDVGDLEHVLTTAGNLEQAAGVGDGLLGVAHEGVLPVSEPLGTENYHS